MTMFVACGFTAASAPCKLANKSMQAASREATIRES